MPLAQHMSGPLFKMETLISESAEFQSLVGVDDAAAALEFIHFGYAEDAAYQGGKAFQVTKPIPRAVIAMVDLSLIHI